MKRNGNDFITLQKTTDKTENPSIDDQLKELAAIIVELLLNPEHDHKIKTG
jgi:hypothetical protein